MTTDIDTFKKLYLQEFGVALTDEEAERRAQSLMRVYKVVLGSPEIKSNDHENVTNTHWDNREGKSTG